jgi:SAM-dependent methyltransferase
VSGDFHAFEHRGWEGAAGAYHGAFGSLTASVADPLLDAAGVERGTRLLDVACGPGYVCRRGVERVAAVTGLDFSQAMLAIAREVAPGAAFEDGDAQALPFADASFDAVTSAFMIGHLADPDRAMVEARRVLRRGGRLAAAWWRGADRALAFGLIWRAIEKHGRIDAGLPVGPPFDQYSEAPGLADLVTRAGLSAVRVEDHEFFWRMKDGEAIFRAYLDGTVRTAGLMRAQAPEALEAIRRDVVASAEAYRRGDSVEVPMAVMVVSGVNP